MPRRGQCRCGLVLTFRRTDQGYKMRCPSCGAVVRLRVKAGPRPPSAPTARLPPLPDEFDVELLPLSDAPPAPRAARPGHWGVALLVIGGALLLLLLAAGGGAAWWFLH